MVVQDAARSGWRAPSSRLSRHDLGQQPQSGLRRGRSGRDAVVSGAQWDCRLRRWQERTAGASGHGHGRGAPSGRPTRVPRSLHVGCGPHPVHGRPGSGAEARWRGPGTSRGTPSRHCSSQESGGLGRGVSAHRRPLSGPAHGFRAGTLPRGGRGGRPDRGGLWHAHYGTHGAVPRRAHFLFAWKLHLRVRQHSGSLLPGWAGGSVTRRAVAGSLCASHLHGQLESIRLVSAAAASWVHGPTGPGPSGPTVGPIRHEPDGHVSLGPSGSFCSG